MTVQISKSENISFKVAFCFRGNLTWSQQKMKAYPSSSVIVAKNIVWIRGFSIQTVVAMLLLVLGSPPPTTVTVWYLRIQANCRGLSPTVFHMDLFPEVLNTDIKKCTFSGRM